MSTTLSRFTSALALVTPLALAGCSLSGTGGSNASAANISGNWSIVSASAAGSVPVSTLMGSLQSTDGKVTGVLHAQDIRLNVQLLCVGLSTDIPVSGTVDASGNVAVSGPLAGGTLSLKGTVLASTLNLPAPFTISVTGGTCAEASQTALGTTIAPVTGSYSGTLTQSNSASNAVVIASLTQSTTPDAHGFFPLSGTIAASGTGCTASFAVTDTAVLGPLIMLNPNDSIPPSLPGFFTGVSAVDASSLSAVTVLVGPPQTGCTSGVSGSLTRH